jgi:hypothetical protein
LQAGQIRRQTPGPQTVAVTVALKVGNESYSSTAQGACTHAPKASIYNVVAQKWTVIQEADGRSVQLTLWRPANGTDDMLSLSVGGRQNLLVSTVRGGEIAGSGTVKLQPSEKGGAFTVNAKAKSGETIAGTIQCAAFTPAIAEGG